MSLRLNTGTTSEMVQTEPYLNTAGGPLAKKRYIVIRRLIVKMCNERNVYFYKHASHTLWNEVRTDAVRHPPLQGFPAKFYSIRIRAHGTVHTSLDALIIYVVKKAVELGTNARLNPDTKQVKELVTNGKALKDERAVACP